MPVDLFFRHDEPFDLFSKIVLWLGVNTAFFIEVILLLFHSESIKAIKAFPTIIWMPYPGAAASPAAITPYDLSLETDPLVLV